VVLSGDDAGVKRATRSLFRDLGWSDDDVFDLGRIESARAVEH
jgi:hypothetical protein